MKKPCLIVSADATRIFDTKSQKMGQWEFPQFGRADLLKNNE